MENVTSQIFSQANETIRLSFEKATEVTSDYSFFVPMIIYFAIIIIIYLIWAGVTGSISSKNFLPFILMLVFFFAIAILLMIFPIWLKLF